MAAVASRPPVPSSSFVTAPSHSVDVAPYSDYTFNASGSPMTTRLRASSDPLSRGGAFTTDQGLLDQEPNPFEQSFSGPHQSSGSTQPVDNDAQAKEPTVNPVASSSNGAAPARRARSNSPPAPRMTPGGVQKLPPLSLIGTPGNELANFGWGVDSLRTGPLSPALLNGPQNSSQSTNLYDPTNLRTGLTPMSSGVSFPPPSPATAALFAMMTNNTPGASDAAAGLAGGGPRPHEGPNEGNPFDASYARATEGDQKSNDHLPAHSGSNDYQPHVQNQPLPLTAAHRSQISSHAGGGRGASAIAPHVMHSGPMQRHMDPYSQPYQLGQHPQMVQPQHAPNHHQHTQQHPRSQTQPSYGNQNPLYLLSQAQDLSNHNDDAVVAAAALSNLSGPGYSPAPEMANSSPLNGVIPPGVVGGAGPGMATRGQQQKHGSPASNGSAPAVAKGKRGAATAANNKRKKVGDEDKKPPAKKGRTARGRNPIDDENDDDEDDDDDFDDMKNMTSSPKNLTQAETEEEKRKNFLERNRQAALKCRQRKKAWLANLQSKVELLTSDNDTLQSTVTNLKDEVASLRAILAAHSNCPIAINNADRRGAAYASTGPQRY